MMASFRSALVTLALAAGARTLQAQSTALVDIRELYPEDYRSQAFVLESPQTVRIEAVAGEPRPDRHKNWGDFGDDDWREEQRTVWPAAAWIIDARTREVVWDVRTAETTRDNGGVRRFGGTVRLPAGTYLAQYGSFVATSTSVNGSFNVDNISDMMRQMRNRHDARVRYRGPYVDDGSYHDFQLVVRGEGRRATDAELREAARAREAGVVVALRGDSEGATERYGFTLDRATDVEITAMGELRRDGAFDYGWILNADTRRRVWTMDYARSEPAGGALKNRQRHETVRLPAGNYVAYYVTDDSHDPGMWNAMPPFDPAGWGLTLEVDADARSRVRPFAYEPVPAGQTIVSMTGIGDDELRSEGFTLRRPMDVRIYAIGEGANPDDSRGAMDDYAWIVDAGTRRRVWTMSYENTEHAGGADKNLLFDGALRLEAGSYLVYYKSDGSHSAGHWNSAPPAEARYWGVSIFPASGTLDRSALAPFERPRSNALAELTRMRDGVRARRNFTLDREQDVRVYAIGEGTEGEMYDYGWIENDSGRTVWEMTFRMTTNAGGARKNRLFDGTVHLAAGRYVLRWESDDSHSFGDWNDDPPDDPEGWGITVLPKP